MARLFARIAAFVLALSAASGVAAQSYTYTFYVGNTNASGCTVQTPAGPLAHVKWRLQATVTAGVAPTFGSVTRADCNNSGVFGSAAAVSSTSAVGLNTGPGGADVIEVQMPVGVVGPTPSPREVLAVVATSTTGADVLISNEASAKGVQLPGGGQPVTIPTLGVLAGLLLGAIVLGLAWFALRRQGKYLMMSLLLVAGTAWAVSIVIDGQTGDWATVTPSSDASGDTGSGEAAIDLLRLYATTQGPNGYLRVDVLDLQNPPVANPGSASVPEDGSTTITLTGSDPGNAPLTFQIASAPTRGTLGPIVPIDATSASVQYTPGADENGGDNFTFTVSNATQTSTPAAVAVTIAPINDAPSFSAANPPSVNENADAQSVANWATFDAGPANESGQAVAEYLVANVSNPALFAAAPTVANDGTLSYTPAAQASGSATFDVTVRDNGGVAGGGVDLGTAQAFTITVNAVNGAPSFTGGGNVAAQEDAGAVTQTGWATAISDGDPEVQALAFSVTANDNPSLFAVAPAVNAASGDLTFTPADGASGSASITLVLTDDGGTANGGSDTSAPYGFTIAISPVNDAPVATAPPALPVHAHIAVSVSDGASGDLLTGANVSDPDGPSPYSLATPTATASANGGQLAIDAATGAFTYNPPAGFAGNDSFGYQVCDSGTPVACSTTVTMTLTVSGKRIWFVDAAAAPGGNGTLQQPLQTLAAANTAASSGDALFLASGTYAGIALGTGREVVGQAVDGSSFDSALAISPPSNSIARPAIDGAYARIENGLAVGNNNTLRGLELDGIGATALTGTGFGTLGVRDDVRIDSDSGALALDTGSFASGSVFASVSSAGGAVNVDFTGVGGTVALGSGSLAGSTSAAFRVNGGNVAATYDGSLAKTGSGTLVDIASHATGNLSFGGALSAGGSGTAVRIESNNGGQVTFAGSAKTLSGSGAATVRIANNTGTAIDFEGGGLAVTGSGATAFDASGGGTVAVRGSGNRITATGGAALRVDGTAIGAAQAAPEGGLRFEKITATGGAGNGIALNATGSAGGLTVTGSGGTCADAASCTGGAITGHAGTGISLTATRGVSLGHVLVDDNDGSGIFGHDLTDFAFAGGRVTNNGNTADGSEANLRFGRLLGSASLSDSVVSGSSGDELRMTPDAGVLSSFDIDGTRFGPGPGNGVSLIASGTADVTVSIDDVEFGQLSGAAVASNGADASKRNLTVTQSSLHDNFSGVNLLGGGNADLTYEISDSVFLRHSLNPIQVASSTSSTNASTWVGEIAGVTIGDGTPDSGARDLHGIAIEMNGDADSIQSITGNSVRNTDIEAIFVQSRLDNDADAQTGHHDFALVDNASGTPDDNSPFPFMIAHGNRIEARNTTSLCLDMAGNSAGSVGGLEHFRLRQRDASGFGLERLSDGDGTPNELILSAAIVEAHIVGQNDAGSTADATLIAGFSETADQACRTP